MPFCLCRGPVLRGLSRETARAAVGVPRDLVRNLPATWILRWTDYRAGTINEAPLAGGTATTLVTGQSDPVGVAAYGGRLYWNNLGTGTLDAANLNGTGVTTLVTGQHDPGGLVVTPS